MKTVIIGFLMKDSANCAIAGKGFNRRLARVGEGFRLDDPRLPDHRQN